MFTGLITDIGMVVAADGPRGTLRRLRIASSYDASSIAVGASIACSGPCLTAVAAGPRAEGGAWFEVDAAAETVARTTAGRWQPGTRLNLERSLKVGDELGGHLVSGHVDAVATILARDEVSGGDDRWGPSARFTILLPRPLRKFIAEKGSVALDGTSLTVNSVADDTFTVLLIPHTLAVTTWGAAKAGDEVNLEIDQMARYAARLAEVGGGP
ncbi:MAG: riboflavin synthase [Methylobacteriaceae bacterium]|nr:riboflavin synthase [Methylobacteriaceae bacterium]